MSNFLREDKFQESLCDGNTTSNDLDNYLDGMLAISVNSQLCLAEAPQASYGWRGAKALRNSLRYSPLGELHV